MARPRSENYDEKRQSIIEESSHLFASVGFDKTSIAMIAKQCSISKALIYHYYKEKAEILYDLLYQHVEGLKKLVRGILDSDESDEKKFLHLVDSLMETYIHTREKHMILMKETNALSTEQQQSLRTTQSEMVHDMATLVSRLHHTEALHHPKLSTAVGLVLLGSLNWTYTWFSEDGPLTSHQFAVLVSEIFLNGVRSPGLDQVSGPLSLVK
ncbi:MAG: TetR/AcrR family transcriptional regulator [Zavarzinia sp.]|nr:TetR/AcrR family transcriptional regulator [Zavarzinia sp.]